MAKIQLKSDYPHNHISVPRVFIDKYMADANGEFVKVYLFLLRCMGSSASSDCSISAIADHFNYTENDILRALKYWEKVGVISLELNANNQLTGLCFKDLTGGIQHTVSEEKQPFVSNETTKVQAPVKAQKSATTGKHVQPLSPISSLTGKNYTLDEKKAFSEDPEIAELLFIMESYLKKPLSSTDMDTVFFWLDELGFTRELVEYLVESSIESQHKSLRYMNKRAIEWAENGVTTVSQAKLLSPKLSQEYYAIMKAMGITNRILIDEEISIINNWLHEFGFSLDIIKEACKRTVLATSKPNFEYANSILKEWHNNNVHTLSDIAALDNLHKQAQKKSNTHQTPVKTKNNNKFNNFHQREYDPDEYEKLILTASLQ